MELSSGKYEVERMAVKYPAKVSVSSPFDPTLSRIRGKYDPQLQEELVDMLNKLKTNSWSLSLKSEFGKKKVNRIRINITTTYLYYYNLYLLKLNYLDELTVLFSTKSLLTTTSFTFNDVNTQNI